MADPGTSRDGRSGNATGESGGGAYHVRCLVLPHGPCSPKAHADSYEKYVVNPIAGTPCRDPPPLPPSSRIEPRPAPRRSSSRGGEAEDAVRHRRSLPAAGNARSGPRDGTMAPGVHRTGETTDGDDERGRRGAERTAPHHLRGACLSRNRVARERCRSGGRPGCCRFRWALRCRSARQGIVVPATAWAAEWRKARPSLHEGTASLKGGRGDRPGRRVAERKPG